MMCPGQVLRPHRMGLWSHRSQYLGKGRDGRKRIELVRPVAWLIVCTRWWEFLVPFVKASLEEIVSDSGVVPRRQWHYVSRTPSDAFRRVGALGALPDSNLGTCFPPRAVLGWKAALARCTFPLERPERSLGSGSDLIHLIRKALHAWVLPFWASQCSFAEPPFSFLK